MAKVLKIIGTKETYLNKIRTKVIYNKPRVNIKENGKNKTFSLKSTTRAYVLSILIYYSAGNISQISKKTKGIQTGRQEVIES